MSPVEALDVVREQSQALTTGPEGGAPVDSHERLLASVPTPVLRSFTERLLGPLAEYDARHNAELLPTLRSFLACDGSWSACASRMYVHVNTVRYRIGRIEALTGRDLSALAGPRRLLPRPPRRRLVPWLAQPAGGYASGMESVAVLSDIHGVLPALDAVLAEPAVLAADRIVLTGDIAAGPQPSGRARPADRSGRSRHLGTRQRRPGAGRAGPRRGR